MKFRTFQKAQEYLFTKIPHSKDVQFPGELGIQRTKHFLKLLGNPQNKYKTIHIAGTSGKGSTAYVLSLVLKSVNVKIGLHISPYIVDLRERIQINNTLISQKKFVQYLESIVRAIEKCSRSKYGPPTYFEILTVLAFYAFWKEKVDYAVIETGLGGTYDATNVITRKDKLCIITRIGKDHTRILGNTHELIAQQKAGIIQTKNQVIIIQQISSVQKAIQRAVQKKSAQLIVVDPKKDISNIIVTKHGTSFKFSYNLSVSGGSAHGGKTYNLKLIGIHQAENASLALTALSYLAKRDTLKTSESKIRSVLQNAQFLGRFEIKKIKGKEVVVDVAHNPQKMRTLIKTLNQIYPGQKFHFLLAFKKGKNISHMLKIIIPFARSITATQFFIDSQDLVHISESQDRVKEILQRLHYKNYTCVMDPKTALKNFLQKSHGPLVITGSIYFIGDIYPFMV